MEAKGICLCKPENECGLPEPSSDYLSLDLKGQFVLKLSDWCYPTEFQKGEHITLKTLEAELRYRRAVLDGSLSGLMDKLQTIGWFSGGGGGKGWDTAGYGAYVQYHVRSFYGVGAGVYDRVEDVQGVYVPRLIAQVRLPEFRYSLFSSPEPTVRGFSRSTLKVEFS